MKILIIGGGIGGLTTALACQHFKIDYEVFEAAPEIREVGAGIWVPPNAMQVMHRLGLSDVMKTTGKELESISVGGPTGKVWYTLHSSDVVPKFGFGTIAIHRARLQKALHAALDPSKVHTGKRLKDFTATPDKVVATFEDGSQATGNCLIGADGLKSQIRKQLFGDMPLRYSGQTCWRGIVEHQLPREVRGAMRELWGKLPGQRFAYSQITDKEVYYYGTLGTPAGETDQPGKTKNTLLRNFSSFGKTAIDIIADIDPAKVIRTDLFDLKPISTWTKENVALLGDAAHATTPNLGQGGAQAIEDAFVLVSELKDMPGNIPAAFQRYQHKRIKKAHYIVNTSWRFGQITNMRNPVGIAMRNWIIRSTPASITSKQIEKIYQVNF
jgi:2-polyprenyl-6-methoxyphenol hydroxylase-like FAD-dependent oxidoreductase